MLPLSAVLPAWGVRWVLVFVNKILWRSSTRRSTLSSTLAEQYSAPLVALGLLVPLVVPTGEVDQCVFQMRPSAVDTLYDWGPVTQMTLAKTHG